MSSSKNNTGRFYIIGDNTAEHFSYSIREAECRQKDYIRAAVQQNGHDVTQWKTETIDCIAVLAKEIGIDRRNLRTVVEEQGGNLPINEQDLSFRRAANTYGETTVGNWPKSVRIEVTIAAKTHLESQGEVF